MNKSKFVALAIGLAAAAPALADNDGLYLGGAVGNSSSKESACVIPDMACNRKDTAYTGSLGFMFTPNWGVEGGYAWGQALNHAIFLAALPLFIHSLAQASIRVRQ